jgi:hypothetical protein
MPCSKPIHTTPRCNLRKVWSARVGLHYRALATEDGADFIWVWLGTHDEYERMIQ